MERLGRASFVLIAVVMLGVAVALWLNLGSSPAEVRLLLAASVLAFALFSGGRWWLARASWILVQAVVGGVVGAVLLLGSTLPPVATGWLVGLHWIAVGVTELVGRAAGPSLLLVSPWTALTALVAGVVLVTFPGVLAVQLTAVSSIWTGTLALMLGFRALRRPGSGVRPQAPGRARSILSVAVPVLLVSTVLWGYGRVVANTVAADARQRHLAPFYEVPPDLAPGEPGDLIRYEAAEVPGLRGRAFRVLFRSDDAFQRPTASSGLVFVPHGQGQDRAVIAWAHGTVGLGEVCAPSRAQDVLVQTPWVNQALEAGFVVTAPDYAGAAGTGDGEAYMVLAEQGRDLVHGVRAAITLPGSGASTRYVTYGESQGGAVSLAAGSMSTTVDPELELVGVGAVASASDLATTLAHKWDSPLATWLLGPHLIRAYTRYYPHLRTDHILTDAARNHYVEIAERSCVFDPLGAVLNPRIGPFLTDDPTTDPAWMEALTANRAPDPLPGRPLFVGHGLADPLFDPATTSAAVVERACAAGSPVTTRWMAGVGHIGSGGEAGEAYLAWVERLLAGGEPPSSCDEPLPGSSGG